MNGLDPSVVFRAVNTQTLFPKWAIFRTDPGAAIHSRLARLTLSHCRTLITPPSSPPSLMQSCAARGYRKVHLPAWIRSYTDAKATVSIPQTPQTLAGPGFVNRVMQASTTLALVAIRGLYSSAVGLKLQVKQVVVAASSNSWSFEILPRNRIQIR